MKQSLTLSAVRLVAARGLPGFSWAQQSPAPTWEAAPASAAGRFRAVGTATNHDTDQYCAWSCTGLVSMGGVSTTLPGGVRAAVRVGAPAAALPWPGYFAQRDGGHALAPGAQRHGLARHRLVGQHGE